MEPQHLRQIILCLFEPLGPDDGLQFVSDRDPRRLRFGLDFRGGVWFDQPPQSPNRWLGQMAFTWQVRLRRLQTEQDCTPHAD